MGLTGSWGSVTGVGLSLFGPQHDIYELGRLRLTELQTYL